MRNSMSIFAILLSSISSFAQNQWKVDPAHSSINLNITHSEISIVDGKFLKYSGSMTTTDEALTDANLNFTVQIKSVVQAWNDATTIIKFRICNNDQNRNLSRR